MIEEIYDINGAYALFRSYNGLANNNCIFYAASEGPITAKKIAKAALIVGAVHAAGGSIIGVQPQGNKTYSAYLVNQTEYGIGLIPLENTSNLVFPLINNMKIVPNSYIFINQNNIKNVTIKNVMFNSFKLNVTIETFDGLEIKLNVYKKNEYLTYHESNFMNFVNRYGVRDNKEKIKKIILTYSVISIISFVFVIINGNLEEMPIAILTTSLFYLIFLVIKWSFKSIISFFKKNS